MRWGHTSTIGSPDQGKVSPRLEPEDTPPQSPGVVPPRAPGRGEPGLPRCRGPDAPVPRPPVTCYPATRGGLPSGPGPAVTPSTMAPPLSTANVPMASSYHRRASLSSYRMPVPVSVLPSGACQMTPRGHQEPRPPPSLAGPVSVELRTCRLAGQYPRLHLRPPVRGENLG